MLMNRTIPNGVSTIPERMPIDLLCKGAAEIPDIGEPTNACFFTMSNIDPAGW